MGIVPGVVRRASGNAARAARLLAARAVLGRRAPFWLLARLVPPFDETRAARLPFARERSPSLLETLRALDAAARDPRVGGVLLRCAGAPHGYAAAASLRRALDAVRAAGKPVAAYGETMHQAEYWVASGADRLWLPETGSIHLVGLRSESIFLARLLARLDLKPDVVRIGSHKAAAETFTRESMSPESREQIEAYLDDVFGELVAAIAAGRRLDVATVRERIDAGPYRSEAACEAGLADGCLYPDQVEEALVDLLPETGEAPPSGGAPRARLIDADAYAALHADDPGWSPLWSKHPRVAYVTASGAIHRRAGVAGISVEALSRTLRALGEDDGVRAIVLRIESPGGDALASDVLWRALSVAKRDKPLVVSMGEVAASGGYFAAVAGDAIFAEAPTLTGSIGVVGGKLDAGALLEKLGVDHDAVERGRRAGLLTSLRGFTPDERSLVRRDMEAVYDVFLRRVEAGRKLTRADLERVAQGRIWSGVRALALGLVDAHGGPLEAIREARSRAGLAADEAVALDVQPRHAPVDLVRGLLGIEASL
jgi:protease-4